MALRRIKKTLKILPVFLANFSFLKLALVILRDFSWKRAKYIITVIKTTSQEIKRDPNHRYKEIVKKVLELGLKIDNVLCVGCKNHHELDAFEMAGTSKVQGIDLLSVDPRIKVMDMGKMSFKDNSFDLLYAGDSLEHSLDIQQAVNEFCRVIKPGGHIAITTPINYATNDIDRWDVKSADKLLALFKNRGARVLWQNIADKHTLKIIIEIEK